MSLYQKGAFILKGLREFTKSGYTAAAKSFNPNDLEIDVTGRSFIITGANSGIGKSAAIEVAKRGGTVHMVCRNPERAQSAKEEIVSLSGNHNIHIHILDTSKLSDVHKFTNKFVSEYDKLDVLINNAGCMVNERTMTSDDLEVNFATNTMGTYIMTAGLIPLLQKTPKSRVITVSSGGMYTAKLNTKDFNSSKGTFDGTVAYSQQKRQQVIVTEEWAKQFREIHFSSMHPGWADTPAVRTSMPEFHRRMKDKLRTSEEGADTVVWLAISDAALATNSGQYFLDRKPQSTHLFLAWTRESASDRKVLLDELSAIAGRVKPTD